MLQRTFTLIRTFACLAAVLFLATGTAQANAGRQNNNIPSQTESSQPSSTGTSSSTSANAGTGTSSNNSSSASNSSNANPNTNPNTNPNPNANINANTNANPNTGTSVSTGTSSSTSANASTGTSSNNSSSASNSSNANPNTNPNTNPNPNANPNANTNANPNTGTSVSTGTSSNNSSNANPNTNPNTNPNPNANPNANTNANPNTNTGTNTATNTSTNTSTGTNTDTSNVLTSGVAVTGVINEENTYREYTIAAQAGHAKLTVELYDLSADLDLYVSEGQSVLSNNKLECVSEEYDTTKEKCMLTNKANVTWYIMVYAYEGGSYSLKATLRGTDNTNDDTSTNTSTSTGTSVSTARLVNISTRAFVGDGMHNEIAGFAVSGNDTKKLVVRATGQGLLAAGVPTGLDAQINLVTYPARTLVSSNANWRAGGNVPLLMSMGVAPGHTSDAADLLDVSPGAYTAEVSPEGDSGIGLIEVFEAPDASGDSRLSNISTRAFVGSGLRNLIAGFAIEGEGTLKLVLRALGQGLAAAGVATNLDARIQVYTYPDRQLIAENDSWGNDSNASELQNLNLNPPHGMDAALIMELGAGAYTVEVVPLATTGIGLIEVFEAPVIESPARRAWRDDVTDETSDSATSFEVKKRKPGFPF